MAKKQAKQGKITLQTEIETLFVHGLLHLLGFDDQTPLELKKMQDLTSAIIAKAK